MVISGCHGAKPLSYHHRHPPLWRSEKPSNHGDEQGKIYPTRKSLTWSNLISMAISMATETRNLLICGIFSDFHKFIYLF